MKIKKIKTTFFEGSERKFVSYVLNYQMNFFQKIKLKNLKLKKKKKNLRVGLYSVRKLPFIN